MPLPFRPPGFWQGSPARPGVAVRLLQPVSWLVGWLAERRLRLAVAAPPPVPVISVGNLVVGGQGKTPLAMALATHLQAAGQTPHLVSRGYGGSLRGPHRVDAAADSWRQVGDEALLLAQTAPTWIARDRAAGVEAAARAGADLVILDDAHQTRSVRPTVSLVVIDAAFGLGNGRVLPAGPLREPAESGLRRAAAVVLVGSGPYRPEGGPVVLRAELEPVYAGLTLASTRVFAFAGIGRPEKFFATLRGLGARLVRTESFPDHHPYRTLTVQRMIRDASALNAILVTTEKDHVRLPAGLRSGITMQKVRMTLKDEAALEPVLAPVRERMAAGPASAA